MSCHSLPLSLSPLNGDACERRAAMNMMWLNHFCSFSDIADERGNYISRIGFLFAISNKTSCYKPSRFPVKHIVGRRLHIIGKRRISVNRFILFIFNEIRKKNEKKNSYAIEIWIEISKHHQSDGKNSSKVIAPKRKNSHKNGKTKPLYNVYAWCVH